MCTGNFRLSATYLWSDPIQRVIWLFIVIRGTLYDSVFLKAIYTTFSDEFRRRSFKLFTKTAASSAPVSHFYRRIDSCDVIQSLTSHCACFSSCNSGEKGALNRSCLKEVFVHFNIHFTLMWKRYFAAFFRLSATVV